MGQVYDFLSCYIKEYGINSGFFELEKFQVYADLLLEWNEKMNLTAITDANQIAIKHFLDSLMVLKYVEIKNGAKIIDIGTGAGFPGVPLKLARQDLNVTLMDSLNKRLFFLENLAENLQIEVELVHARAEEAANNNQYREQFDVAVSRAVAPMNILAEYCIPFVKLGGVFVAMKGPDSDHEMNDAERAIAKLGGKIKIVHKFILPEQNARSIIVIEKVARTTEIYPRHGSKIAKKPL